MNYFEMFSLPVEFITDRTALRERYFSLSRNAHPDYFVNESAPAQQNALESAAELNKAYKTLGDADASIEYVLQLKGVLTPGETYALPPQFLIEMMEINEQLDEAQDAEAIAAVTNVIAALQKEIYEPVKDIIENYRAGTATQEELLQVKEYHFKKKYLQRVRAGLGQK